MCTKTVQVSPCDCRVILRHTCALHIAHTHKQIDNAPCPKFHRKIIPGGSRCRPGSCPAKKDRFYTFEMIGESLFEHTERIDRQWREERFRREEERLAREERIKEESGGEQRLKRVKREYSQEVESNVKMEGDEDFSIKAKHEDVVYSDLEDEDDYSTQAQYIATASKLRPSKSHLQTTTRYRWMCYDKITLEMCIETTQRFYTCLCTIVRTKICISHVEHTHKQIDDNPCPKIQKRFVETRDGGCDLDVPCEMKIEQKWVFAGWRKGIGDRCFVENGTRFHGELAITQCAEEGGWRIEERQACGIGKGWKGEWRHMNGFENRKRQIDRVFERRSELRCLVRKKANKLKGDAMINDEDNNLDNGTDIKEEDRMDTSFAIEEDAMEE